MYRDPRVADDVFGIVGSVQAEVFQVTAVVAEGGFAVVYRAHHRGFNAEVALKCLKIPSRLQSEQKQAFLRKFREEGELLFRLSASMPPIVRPLHVGVLSSPRSDFAPFIALEWLEGESLTQVVRRRHDAGKAPLDLARAVRLLGPAARALERAHAFPTDHGIVSVTHRDFKPDNVFIAQIHGQQVVKVLDFGIGKVKSEAAQIAGQVSTGNDTIAAFTPAYGAPEQWAPDRFGQTGPWTDVWGLALTLVETLTGRQPLEGDVPAVVGACMDERRRPTPRRFGVVLPDALDALFVRALAVHPQRRFGRIGDFWDPLESAVGVHTPRFGAEPSALESVLPPPEYETTLPGIGVAVAPLLAGELVIDTGAQPIPDLELEPSFAVSGSRKRTMQQRRSELSIIGNELPLATIREVRLIEPVHTALEVDTSLPVPSRRRVSPPAPAPRPGRALLSRLAGPLRLIVLAVLLMIVDFLYLAIAGEPLSFGPARMFWISAPLAGAGLVGLIRTLLAGD